MLGFIKSKLIANLQSKATSSKISSQRRLTIHAVWNAESLPATNPSMIIDVHPFPTPISRSLTLQTLCWQTPLQSLHRNLEVQRTFHQQSPNQHWTSYDHIPPEQIGGDDLVDIVRKVLDDPVQFEKFVLRTMSVVVEEDAVQVHWFQTPPYAISLNRGVILNHGVILGGCHP